MFQTGCQPQEDGWSSKTKTKNKKGCDMQPVDGCISFRKKMLKFYKNKSIHINYLVFLLKILLKSGIITGGSQK